MWMFLIGLAQAQDHNCNGVPESAEGPTDPADPACLANIDTATGLPLSQDWYHDYVAFGCAVFLGDAQNDIDADGFGYGLYDTPNGRARLSCDVCPPIWDPTQDDTDLDGIGDACSDTLYLALPEPGTAGAINELEVLDAAIGSTVQIAVSTSLGATPSASCAGLTLDLAAPVRFDQISAGSLSAVGLRWVPAAAAGQEVYLQALDLTTCRVSNVVRWIF